MNRRREDDYSYRRGSRRSDYKADRYDADYRSRSRYVDDEYPSDYYYKDRDRSSGSHGRGDSRSTRVDSRAGRGDRASYSRSNPRYSNGNSSRRRPSSSRKRTSKLKIAVIAAIVVVVVGAGSAFAYYQNVSGNLHLGLDQNLKNVLVKTNMNSEPFYMLLMGTDASEERESDESFGGSFRTDTIMLMRVDPVDKKVSLVSIHRDTEVDLGNGYGTQKINAAHALGGASLSVQAVSKMAGVDISHYAEINFDGFADIVDALGGVEVDVPVEINDDDAGGHLDAGLQTLNGDQALILCRSRNTYANYADPDSMRAANQRLVLQAIAKKILNSDVATISSSVQAISQYVTTDLNVSDIIGLAQNLQGLDPDTDIYTAMEPVTSEYRQEDAGWYTRTNETEWKKMMQRMDAGLPPSEEAQVDEYTGTVLATSGDGANSSANKSASISIRNGTGVQGLAADAQSKLNAAGFVNVTCGNANATDYDKTLVIYDNTNLAYEADQIAQALGTGTAMKNDGNYLYDGDFLVIIGADWPGCNR